MKRRKFLSGLLLASADRFALAQRPAKIYRIAIVHPSRPTAMLTEDGGLSAFAAFFKELRKLGYIEGGNLLVERYSGEGRTEHYADLARDVVLSHPDLIFTVTTRMAQHFKATATTIPIVAYLADPVASGLARSLAQPGGNITGVIPDVGADFWGKQLEFLKVVVPTARKVAYLTPRQAWNMPAGVAIRKAANQIDQVLKGAKPGELPFYQATKFKLTINLNTAKVLGLAIPQSVLLRADEVIQ